MDRTRDVPMLHPRGFAVFIPPPEFDLAVAGEALSRLEQLIDNVSTHVVADMSHVEFIDSTGLRALVSAHRLADERGGRLVLSGSSPTTLRLLEITRLEELLVNYPSLDDVP